MLIEFIAESSSLTSLAAMAGEGERTNKEKEEIKEIAQSEVNPHSLTDSRHASLDSTQNR